MKAHAARLIDLLAALFVLLIVGGLLVPLPLPVLDLALALNLALALLLLATALLMEKPLGLSTFPTLLLVSTLFRLALNVSSTRQILGQGEAGEIIEAFGAFVVGGSTIVGAVVFVILTVIQLVVVAKGAERVAEVGARFTLDGLPGKQLSIDADIRSGACTQAEGAQRRATLEEESRFYGALDGAMKFVKGDAIAGLLITAINIVGGLGIGVGVQGLGIAEAAARFTLLSIGDGLLSQLPALLSSVAAGVVVTRVARAGARGGSAGEVARQLVSDPRALGLTIFLLLLLGAVPGLPLLPFFAAALLLGVLLLGILRSQAREDGSSRVPATPRAAGPTADPKRVSPSPALMIEIASDPTGSDPPKGDPFRMMRNRLIPTLRREFEQNLGFPLPDLGLREGPPGRLRLLLHGAAIQSSAILSRPLLCLDPDEAHLLGIEGRPCLFAGKAALEIDEAGIATAARCGLQVQQPEARLHALLAGTLREHASELLSLQGSMGLLQQVEQRGPALLEEIRSRFEASQLHLLLRSLLEEGVSLQPLEPLLEALLPVEPASLAGEGLRRARRALGRQIVRPHLRDGHLPVVLLDPLCDARLHEALVSVGDEEILALGANEQAALLHEARRSLAGSGGVLLVPTAIRQALARLLGAGPRDQEAGEVGRPPPVLAFEELPRELTVLPLARLSLDLATLTATPEADRQESLDPERGSAGASIATAA